MQAFLHHPILVFVVACFLTAGLMPGVIWFARRFELLSPIDFRRKNKQRVPLLGGLAIYSVLALITLLFELESFYLTLACALPILAVGVLDDKFQLSAKPRVIVHLLSVVAWLAFTPKESLFWSSLGWPDALAYPLVVFWMVGVINAINMIDGMDMEAGGFALIVAVSMFFIGGQSQEVMPLLVLAGACLGFVWHNRPPAAVYLGDGGSTFLGFTLASNALTLPQVHSGLLWVLVPLFLLSFPEVDAVLSMIRRWKSNTSLFRGDHDHIHHKLRKVGLSLTQSLIIIYSATLYSGMTAWAISLSGETSVTILISLLSAFGLCALLGGVYFLEHQQARQVSRVSQTILRRYVDITHKPKVDPDDFRATVYDLLPYYKELQLRGIAEVDEFVREFAAFLREHHPKAQVITFGSYTVISIESENAPGLESQGSLANSFAALLTKHNVLKNDQGLPWGLKFYSAQSKAETFLRKFAMQDKLKPATQAA
jgi:UDP-GlcNAc:undecaprenyl-phosphate GlcNAc-1-phosphate transferase